jgi:hypothetical protein
VSKKVGIYPAILERSLLAKFKAELRRVSFESNDLEELAKELAVRLRKTSES